MRYAPALIRHLRVRQNGAMAADAAANGSLVLRETVDRIAVLTLDSPGNRNALSRAMVAALRAELEAAAADESLHGVLVRSSHRVFCAGADLKEARSVDMVESAKGIIALQRAMAACPVPVVVRLDGPVRAAYGIGRLHHASSRFTTQRFRGEGCLSRLGRETHATPTPPAPATAGREPRTEPLNPRSA